MNESMTLAITVAVTEFKAALSDEIGESMNYAYLRGQEHMRERVLAVVEPDVQARILALLPETLKP